MVYRVGVTRSTDEVLEEPEVIDVSSDEEVFVVDAEVVSQE